MFYALTWAVLLILLTLWSLMVWAFHATAAWTVAKAGLLSGGPAAFEALRVPEWLAPWIAPELTAALKSMLLATTPAIEAVLNQAPALAGGLSVASWAIWAIGSIFLVVLGLAVTGLIAAVGHRRPTPTASARSQAAAG